MNDAEIKTQEPLEIKSTGSKSAPFLQRAEWVSFGITVLLTFAIYLFTLSPSVDLDFSGIFATGAMYPGVSHVPGFPLWTLYSYLFTILLPISNIAWRVNVASAVASALACGFVALLASRCSGALLKDFAEVRRLETNDEVKLRVVCGCVAGLVLGFDGAFWHQAVIAFPWNFSVLLFVMVLVLLMRWQHAPEQTRWFQMASFVYGLTLTNSQELAPGVVGIGCFVLFAKPALARDIFAAGAVLVGILLAGQRFEFLPGLFVEPPQISSLFNVYLAVGIIALLLTVILGFVTRAMFTCWRTVLTSGLCFVLGLLPYFLVPVFSMTTPPMDWGHPRTVEGFLYVVSRGQYERVYPADSWSRFFAGQFDLLCHNHTKEFRVDLCLFCHCALFLFATYAASAAPVDVWPVGHFSVVVPVHGLYLEPVC